MLLAAQLASAHCEDRFFLLSIWCLGKTHAHIQFLDTFPDLIANGTVTTDWHRRFSLVQQAELEITYQVTDVTSQAVRCYELDSNSASEAGTATIVAGSTVGFKADNTMGHPGYFSAYMTPASPAANSNQAGLGKTWFKIWEWSPRWTASTGLIFDSLNIDRFNFTIPKNVPSGQYLLRGEQIALHVASTEGGAQLYIGCAQINVVNGGSGSPGPTVSFHGLSDQTKSAYSQTDPGILINIYNLPAGYSGYRAPGPAVWSS
ncbi:putative endo-beta-1,4-glucanase D [Leucoagaricus sp. SymC.cos]|nr:putative endo-beta-1,4-glucanase D [Leucoagaricus sp. SymC.cos]